MADPATAAFETAVQRHLTGCDFPVPTIRCGGQPNNDLDRAWSVMDFARLGSMFELSWDDAAFDAVMSINGVWGGCEAALVEAHRVLRHPTAARHQLLGVRDHRRPAGLFQGVRPALAR